jgi:hypothetical protein
MACLTWASLSGAALANDAKAVDTAAARAAELTADLVDILLLRLGFKKRRFPSAQSPIRLGQASCYTFLATQVCDRGAPALNNILPAA